MNNLSVMFQLELSHLQGVMLHKILTTTLCSCVSNHCSSIKLQGIRHSVLRYKSLTMTRSGMKNVCHVIYLFRQTDSVVSQREYWCDWYWFHLFMSFTHNWMSQHVKNGLTHQLSAASVSVERYKLAVCMYRQKVQTSCVYVQTEAHKDKKEHPFTDPHVKIL